MSISIRAKMRRSQYLQMAVLSLVSMSVTSWGASNDVLRSAGFECFPLDTSNRVLTAMSLNHFEGSFSPPCVDPLIGNKNRNNLDPLLKYDSTVSPSITFWRTPNSTLYQAVQAVQSTNTLKAGEDIGMQTCNKGFLIPEKPKNSPPSRMASSPRPASPSAPLSLRAAPPIPSAPSSPTGLRVSSKP